MLVCIDDGGTPKVIGFTSLPTPLANCRQVPYRYRRTDPWCQRPGDAHLFGEFTTSVEIIVIPDFRRSTAEPMARVKSLDEAAQLPGWRPLAED